jgi:predicted nucleic-acid-binding Zn-ribbon protein
MNEYACAKCNSTERVPGARVVDHGHYNAPTALEVAVQVYPAGLLFTGDVTHKVNAHVCGNCGYVEFYAENPQELMAKAQRGLKHKKQD